MNRRYFLMGTAAAASQVAVWGFASPNDTIRIGCAGVRGQGRAHLSHYMAMQDVEVTAIRDIDESILNSRIKMVEDKTGKRPAAYTDIRKMLEDKNIDVVSIATPNHSHTLQTIWSLQAGKDVYVEKPCSHDPFEPRRAGCGPAHR